MFRAWRNKLYQYSFW